jgi:hypothetical protein
MRPLAPSPAGELTAHRGEVWPASKRRFSESVGAGIYSPFLCCPEE